MARSSRSQSNRRHLVFWYGSQLLLLVATPTVHNLFTNEILSYIQFTEIFPGIYASQGNLGWAYMQQNNYEAAELVYRKAQTIEPDANRACNLGLCLIKLGRHGEARQTLEDVLLHRIYGSDDEKVVARAEQLLHELDPFNCVSSPFDVGQSVHEEIMERLDLVMNGWTPFRSRRLPVFEEIATFRDQIAC